MLQYMFDDDYLLAELASDIVLTLIEAIDLK